MKFKVMYCGLVATILIVSSCLVIESLAPTQQQRQQRCFDELRFCINYIDDTSKSPPDSCCQPLDYVIRSIPECFCSVISNIGGNLIKQLAGINISNAQTLPNRCGQHINPLWCVTGTPIAPSKNNSSNSNSVKFKFWSPTLITSVVVLLITVVYNCYFK